MATLPSVFLRYVCKITTKDQIYSVAYGMFIELERSYEKYQYRRFFSAFAPEDFPSDHLGFWAYMHGLKRSDTAFLLECLGKVTDYGTSPFAGIVVDTFSTGTGYGFSFAKNREFLPMVTETFNYGNGVSGTQSVNIPWPTWLEIQPISSGPNTWQVKDRSHKWKRVLKSCGYFCSLLCLPVAWAYGQNTPQS